MPEGAGRLGSPQPHDGDTGDVPRDGAASWDEVEAARRPPPMPPPRGLAQRLPSGLRNRLRDLAERLEPPIAVVRPRWRKEPIPPLGIAMVYRARNSAGVERFLAAASRPATALWALDETTPALADRTVGVGKGSRISLLNKAIAALDLPADGWLLVADDDVDLRRGDIDDLVRCARYVGFDVTQPTHAAGSTHLWGINRHRVLSLARATRFVETGPAFLMSPTARQLCLPLPEDFSMGIGSEAVWGGRPELRLGVVDAVTMMHRGVVGAAYDAMDEWDRTQPLVRSLLAPVGLRSVYELAQLDGRWRWWQPRPPWAQR